MKKTIFALSALLMLPVLSFFGCGDAETFSITTSSNYETVGSASPQTVEAVKGSKVKLKATELNGETNPFVCWVKDKSQVVSTEKEFEITASATTEGEYTALFEDPDMRFATLNKISYTGQENYVNFVYSVSYTIANQQMPLCDGQIGQREMTVFDKNVVFLPSGTQINFSIELSASNSEREYHFPVYQIKNLSNETFDGEKTWVYATEDGNFTFEFVKLTGSLFAK